MTLGMWEEVAVLEYVVQRHGAREWLGADGQLVRDPRDARVSGSLAEAHAWRAEQVDDISLWDITPYNPPCPVCGAAW